MTTIGILYAIFLVPEMRGHTLEDMHELFGTAGMAAADAARQARIESESGLLVGLRLLRVRRRRRLGEISHYEEFQVRGVDGENGM